MEHPQQIIDQIQYNCNGKRDTLLPAAAYSLVKQVNERGVYSFCMCPGGFIVPAATDSGEVVVNGMSPSRRNNKFANSGIVVELDIDKDFKKYEEYGPLRGLEFQKDLEKISYYAGDLGFILFVFDKNALKPHCFELFFFYLKKLMAFFKILNSKDSP